MHPPSLGQSNAVSSKGQSDAVSSKKKSLDLLIGSPECHFIIFGISDTLL